MSDQVKMSSGGFRLPLFGRATGRTAIRASDANDLVYALNILGNIQIVRSEKDYDEVFYSDGNLILSLKKETQAPNVEGSITVAEQDGTPSVANVTTIKFTNGTVTDEGSGVVSIDVPSSGFANAYKVVSTSTTEITCHSWDGTTEGTDPITVAKPPYLREMPDFGDDDADIFPPYEAGDVIFAVTVNTSGTGATLLDLNVDSRQWKAVTEGCDENGDPRIAYFDRTPWETPA